MKKPFVLIAILALLSAATMAQDAPKEEPHGREGKHRSMLADIPDLTEAQKTQIKQIRENTKQQTKGMHEELRSVREKIADLKRAESPDMGQINTLIDRAAKLRADMAKIKLASEMKVRSVLTPEQREVLDAKQQERMEMRKKKHAQKGQEQKKK